MKTEYKLAETLKIMMADMPLDSISVTTLTKKCKVKRQTFYYHFHDIYDLLTLVFLSEEIPGIKQVKSLNDLVTSIYKYYDANKGFVEATINSAGKELFQEFIYNVCYQTMLKSIGDYSVAKKLHANDKKAIARFYALAYSNSIVYYLSAYKNKTLNGLLNCFAFQSESVIKDAVERMVEVRGAKE